MLGFTQEAIFMTALQLVLSLSYKELDWADACNFIESLVFACFGLIES